MCSPRGGGRSGGASSHDSGVSGWGKASDRDKSDTLGGPFTACYVESLGSRMMYLSATLDNDTDTDGVVREGPHQMTVEETAGFRTVESDSATCERGSWQFHNHQCEVQKNPTRDLIHEEWEQKPECCQMRREEEAMEVHGGGPGHPLQFPQPRTQNPV